MMDLLELRLYISDKKRYKHLVVDFAASQQVLHSYKSATDFFGGKKGIAVCFNFKGLKKLLEMKISNEATASFIIRLFKSKLEKLLINKVG